MRNRSLLLTFAIIVAGAVGVMVSRQVFMTHDVAPPALAAVHLMSPPRELPAFSLRQSDGTQLVKGELKGHWTLVYLGFTHCPDVCPTTLGELAHAQKQWETLPESTRPRLLFVSVDPDRDTPDKVGEYAHAFHRDTLAATADTPTLERFAQSLSLVFQKMPIAAGAPVDSYAVDHSATLVVLDPQARMAAIIQPPFDARAIAADMITLTRRTP